ncbi:MAG: Tetratricopeptide 2 repeat protein [Pedosphaera sp.]|nr:Tetratricopeptide 2 repeat protein [Pedosphaera sp.]
MTTETQSNREGSFVSSWLPWVLAAGMLLVYLLTANHRVWPGSVPQVALLSGWTSQPNLLGPITFLVTYPLRWLPASSLPAGLSFFSALCAALALAQLARSVALLPHDRTHDQRQREQSEFSLLTTRNAWLPPALAVLVCGFQITFWEHSTEGTGEMLDLLLFAYLTRCLLEFRLSQNQFWLTRFALLYGMAMANNWAMIAFIPCFLTAVVWIKGLSFFNLRFLGRTSLACLAGLSLFLLLPLIASLSHTGHLNFWTGLHLTASAYRYYLSSLPRAIIFVLCLTSVLPVFILSIRWASSFGDTSPLGIFLATAMFHIVHALFLIACLWGAFDSPLSPRMLGFGVFPFLPLYYLGALSIGYFSGYFLLIFGARIINVRRRPAPLMAVVNVCVVAIVWLLFLATPTLLLCKNLPAIERNRNNPFVKYLATLGQLLPPRPVVILSDDRYRLFMLESMLSQEQKKTEYLFMDTGTMAQDPTYIKFLNQQHPQFKLAEAVSNDFSHITQPAQLIHLLEQVSQHHDIYYLHPSFGYYFERFYMVPHGPICQLKPLSTNDLTVVPKATKEQIAENQEIWAKLAAEQFPQIVRAIKPPSANGLMHRLMAKAHISVEPDGSANLAGHYYARALDFWGVELQKAGLFQEAADYFSQAQNLNPDSVAAQVNGEFNHELQAGNKVVVLSPKAIEDKFGTRRSWNQILQEDGPFDHPSFCYQLGATFAKNGLRRQAIQQFDRVEALAPNQTDAQLWLSQMYFYLQDYSNSVVTADKLLQVTPNNTNGLFLKGIALLQLGNYNNAIASFNRLMSLQTNNYAAQLNRAIAQLQAGNLNAARQDYEVVGKVVPQAYQVYYGLAEIAYRQKDTPAAIKNYQLYLTNAPPDTTEAKMVSTRLKELKPEEH